MSKEPSVFYSVFKAQETLKSTKEGSTQVVSLEELSCPYAPLAQLVEQLTLNQWVPGSNP